MTIQQDFHKNYTPPKTKTEPKGDNRLAEYASRLQADEISNLYSQASTVPERVNTAGISMRRDRKGKTDPYDDNP